MFFPNLYMAHYRHSSFLSKIHIKKPQNREIALMIAFGVLEFAILAMILVFMKL